MSRLLLLSAFILTLNACELFIGIDGKRLDGFVNFDYVRDRIKNSYAQLAWKEKKNNFNWDEVTRKNRTRIKSKMSAPDLIKELKDTLNHLKDAHVLFRLPEKTTLPNEDRDYPTYKNERFEGKHSGFSFGSNKSSGRERLIEHYLVPDTYGYSKEKIMLYGKFLDTKSDDKNIGYLHINSFISSSDGISTKTLQDWARDIDPIVAKLIDTDGLILDTRQNGGGYPGNMLWIAGRFVNAKKHFMNMYMKNGPGPNDFAKAYEWHVDPQGPKKYTKPIILLTDGGTGSNGEYFTLALRNFDHITHVGQNTKGITGYFMLFEMPNGWSLGYTTGYSLGFTADNKEERYEQDGIPPKTEITFKQITENPDYIENGGKVDPMIDEAITLLDEAITLLREKL